jgi:hypothetical protein
MLELKDVSVESTEAANRCWPCGPLPWNHPDSTD